MRAEIRIILHQLLVIILAVAVAKYLYASLAAMGVLYGGLISVSTSAIMAYRMAQAAGKAAEGSLKGNLYVYLGAIERICIAIVLFALGFSWLNFSPLPMVIGLMAGQIGFMIGAFKVKD